MNLFSVLSAVTAPKSLWVTLINWIQRSAGNLGWTIILVTVFIKLVTTPLDFWVKLNSKKQTLLQQAIALLDNSDIPLPGKAAAAISLHLLLRFPPAAALLPAKTPIRWPSFHIRHFAAVAPVPPDADHHR